MPKTAGTSFRLALEQGFGEGFMADYADLPLNTPRPRRELAALRAGMRLAATGGLSRHVTCVHGHFLALKYRFLTALSDRVSFVIWLRDPVERLVSHYRFWMQATDTAGLPVLHRRVVEEQWSLERFCFSPDLRNLSHQFLFGFPVQRLDFVGIVERADADFAVFSRRYLGPGAPRELPRVNLGSHGAGVRHFDDAPLRRRIEAFHRKDMDLYRYFLSRPPA
jgi:hypothetical protein